MGGAAPKKRTSRVATPGHPAIATVTASSSAASRQQSRKSATVDSARRDANQLGARLRERRESLGITLRQFARDLDISASFISQIETDKAQPSVATLYAICRALDMSLDDLYATDGDAVGTSPRTSSSDGRTAQRTTRPFGAGRSPVVRSTGRKSITMESGVTWERLTATAAENASFTFVRYDVGGSSNAEGSLIRHVGTEYWYVISGFLAVTLGFETYRLGPGDSISFNSSTPHLLSNDGDSEVQAVWFDVDHDFQMP
ncbi:MAG: XRE family transcriptional regulator [Acidimicrobiales bacterium]